MKTLKRFFDDINAIANNYRDSRFSRPEIVVTLSQEDRDLLANFRRRKVVKKTQPEI